MVTNLKNDDFRRLLATPSVRTTASATTTTTTSTSSNAKNSISHSFTHKQNAKSGKSKKPYQKPHAPREKPKDDEDNLFSESQTKLNEILSNYRDRALERRKGSGSVDDALIRARMSAAYKALPGTASAAASLAERRRMEIQESKYLGGDMEHTHLVRGLDYSLLNKVRGEMNNDDGKDDLEQAYEESIKKKGGVNDSAQISSNNRIVKNINRVLFQNEKPPLRNELFSRGRMAYIVELEDDEEDVPSTLMRSVVDCPLDQSNENINANNELNNKLAQVLGYLRTDTKKRRRVGDGESAAAAAIAAKTFTAEEIKKQKIYDDVEDYNPLSKTTSSRNNRDRRGGGGGDRDRNNTNSSYFDASGSHSRNESSSLSRNDRRDVERSSNRDSRDSRDYRNESRGGNDYNKISSTTSRQQQSENPTSSSSRNKDPTGSLEKSREEKKKRRMEDEEDYAYAELYPSGIGMLDSVGGESDEEADFSKMDMGNRKGPIKRWDFDTEKDFESYQEGREAMPKAAYQYGVKMNGGRKTRKNAAAAGEKKLDREMEKINKIWDERKKKGDQRY